MYARERLDDARWGTPCLDAAAGTAVVAAPSAIPAGAGGQGGLRGRAAGRGRRAHASSRPPSPRTTVFQRGRADWPPRTLPGGQAGRRRSPVADGQGGVR